MRYLKFISISCIIFFMSFCKKETKIKSVYSIESSLKLNVIDTLIESIDSSKISNIQDNKQKIIELFFKSFQKDYNKPVINFNQVKNNHEKIEVKKYVDFIFNGKTFKTFLISYSYENDELYRSILLANTVLEDGLIIYEKVLDEGE